MQNTKRYKDYEIVKSTICGYGEWMVKLYPTTSDRFETLFAPTEAQAKREAVLFMQISNKGD